MIPSKFQYTVWMSKVLCVYICCLQCLVTLDYHRKFSVMTNCIVFPIYVCYIQLENLLWNVSPALPAYIWVQNSPKLCTFFVGTYFAPEERRCIFPCRLLYSKFSCSITVTRISCPMVTIYKSVYTFTTEIER